MRISGNVSSTILSGLIAGFITTFLAPAADGMAQTPAPSAGGQAKVSAPATSSSENVLSAHGRSLYGGTKQILLASAENMPEENYDFRPIDTVRTYGQIVGHVADSQYAFCSVVMGLKNPSPNIEKTKTSKADLIAALEESFAFCDKAYDALTDESAAELVRFMGGDKPKLGVLTINNVHTIEHYGNLVTYMRMKSIVPPTSDETLMKRLIKK